jgi:type IV pilus assembly protein PilM|tara:strand:+ start:1233 stop:2288 length:1056 start_codon:yes stop_codon:yes gene_type:complete
MFLGLDIGRQYVKMVAMNKTKDGYKLIDAGQRLVPDPNQAFDPDKIETHHWVMAIKELLRQQGLNPKKVKVLATSISGASASVKQITTMEMPAEELASAMTFEARKHIPMDGTDAVIDYQILGSNAKEVDKIDVGLVACTKGVLSAHIDLLKECGFKPGVIDVDPIAVTNTFTFLKDIPEDGLAVLLDIGALSSSLVVWGSGQQYFTRDIPIGGHHFVKEVVERREINYTEAQDLLYRDGVSSILKSESGNEDSGLSVADRSVLDNIVEDIRRSLRFYAKQTGQSFFLKIFLTGGAAETPGLTDLISSKLSIDCDTLDPFDGIEGADSISVDNASQYVLAMGLSLRAGMEQ